ncbi:MAG: imidazole glycerol phosphate synthase subunit HisH [Cytophagales bacterium]|nr:imidazole glycerol phosphate synthase subunit HisH [Cytophagales bacterium]MDW8384519.1 imidazole glycerol phosphate synthase subunit HisH [Flammeovirgaceae bacterium]
MKVAIVKYNAGNVQSVIYALHRLGIEPLVTDVAEELMSADKVIFPGVGEAQTAMRYLRSKKLDQLIKRLKQPVLGICIGLQLLCNHSEEGDTNCMGVFDVNVRRFPNVKKVPQIGWNNIYHLKSPLFEGIAEQEYVYFVHSYYAEISPFTIAEAEYILPYSAALQKENFYAVQFHAEKSGKIGSKILENFLSKC